MRKREGKKCRKQSVLSVSCFFERESKRERKRNRERERAKECDGQIERKRERDSKRV